MVITLVNTINQIRNGVNINLEINYYQIKL